MLNKLKNSQYNHSQYGFKLVKFGIISILASLMAAMAYSITKGFQTFSELWLGLYLVVFSVFLVICRTAKNH